MAINATIIVQACNLFVTFWIVRFLLINPVIEALSEDQEKIDNLHTIIKHTQKEIVAMEMMRESYWDEARKDFENDQPQERSVSDHVFKDIAPIVQVVPFSKDDKQIFIEQVKQKLVARLEHDRS